MKIAILSGKGGTGKTLVSVNLAAVAEHSTYIDCDVEEPNGHLFFKPEQVQAENVTVRVPVVDRALCNGCRKCIDFCRFGALAYSNNGLMVFADICHSCGGCVLVCPEKALTERERAIGQVHRGVSQDVECLTGILNTGEASGVPVINELLQCLKEKTRTVLIDCPPGSACIVMESIKDADYCILVAEPTLFGVHNLQMVWDLVKLFQKPFGVVLNKCLPGENPAEIFCLERDIEILARIPFSEDLGLINSQGRIAARKDGKYEALFVRLLDTVTKEVQGPIEAVTHP
ncbi:MAG TPA: ATP-binding protein [Limnochordia bacterium]|nr:ATP-binding protein [Limnochordia bacterium]